MVLWAEFLFIMWDPDLRAGRELGDEERGDRDDRDGGEVQRGRLQQGGGRGDLAQNQLGRPAKDRLREVLRDRQSDVPHTDGEAAHHPRRQGRRIDGYHELPGQLGQDQASHVLGPLGHTHEQERGAHREQ